MAGTNGYSNPDDEESGQDFGILGNKFAVIFILVAVVWFFARWGQGPMLVGGDQFTSPPVEAEPIGAADFWFIFFIPVLLAIKGSDQYLHVKSPGLVCNPIHSTTRGYTRKADIYACFRLGSVDAYGLHWNGHDGTLIAPRDAVTEQGRNFTVNGYAIQVSSAELPPSIRKEIILENWPKPYWMVYASEHELGEPDVQSLIEQNRQLCRMNDDLQKTANKVMVSHEEWWEHVNKMKPGWYESLKRTLTGKANEEE